MDKKLQVGHVSWSPDYKSSKGIPREDLPLITGKIRNEVQEKLGKIYRVKTNPPKNYPEIACCDYLQAERLLVSAFAEIEHLKKEREQVKQSIQSILNDAIKYPQLQIPEMVEQTLRSIYE